MPLRVKETLPQEVLTKMHAPGQDSSIPFITPDILASYDVSLSIDNPQLNFRADLGSC